MSEVKAGHLAGPFDKGSIPNAKINGFMSVSKPDGSRRQIGNLSAPKGLSFNDGIPVSTLKTWTVKQTTSKEVANMIVRAGRDCILSCSDMVAAYKNIPVKLQQRPLQVFRFCGKDFVDTRLVFGDKAACMWFDRFHHCIIHCFIRPKVPIPMSWVGRTVDDIPTVCPSSASQLATEFVAEYRRTLQELNIRAAPEDPKKQKAFDGSKEGVMLGIQFNSNNMTSE